MASNGIKMEGDLNNIKMDPELASPLLADIDEFEDTGELVMPKKVLAWGATEQIPTGWLLRIPKELWAGLADLPMDEEIHIGNVKVWEMANGKDKYRLDMNSSIPGWNQIPKQYDMTPTEATTKKDKDPILKNTFLFSEKNLPGFRRNNGARGGFGQAVDPNTGGPIKVEKPRQRGPRTIPKHTEMLGQVEAEFICSPRDNEEFRRIRAAKEEALKGKIKKLSLLQGDAATALIRNGMIESTSFATTAPTKKKRSKQDDKATRMEENELIDALTRLFRRHKYWPMARIKRELHQPEAYLKIVLGRIATLVKHGQAANTWALNDTYLAGLEYSDELRAQGFKEEMADSVKPEEIAPIKMEDGDGDEDMEDEDDDDDEDDDEEFDVVA